MSERESWLAVVQRGDEPSDQESELVVITRSDPGAPPVIELTDGVRITCLEPAGDAS